MKSVAKDLVQMQNKDLTTREKLLKEGKLSSGYNP